jgi:hypothetical protein
MKIFFKNFLVVGMLVLFIDVGSNVTAARENQTESEQQISNTITHLENALRAVNANELDEAQGHIKAAGQSSKAIIGGSFEARKQAGSKAISKARSQAIKSDTAGMTESLKKALEVFKSLLRPADVDKQGGLD